MFALAISALLALPPGTCDTPDHRQAWPKDARAETFARVQATCEAIGAAPFVCTALQAITQRETRGAASRLHTSGHNESGAGPHGLSRRWHRRKWDGTTGEFCVPEVSTVVVFRIFWIAVLRYHARDLRDLQAIFAGRTGRDTQGRRRARRSRGDRAWCGLLRQHGVDCRRKVTPADLGRRLVFAERRAFVAGLGAG